MQFGIQMSNVGVFYICDHFGNDLAYHFNRSRIVQFKFIQLKP